MTQATLPLAWRSRKRDANVPFATAVRRTIAIMRLWRERARQRRALAALDPRLLRDIGVTPSEARRETDKPFWR